MSKRTYRYLMLGVVLSACHQGASSGGDSSSIAPTAPSPEVTAPTEGGSADAPPTEANAAAPAETNLTATETAAPTDTPTKAPEVVAEPIPAPAPVVRPDPISTFKFTVDGQTRTYATKNPVMCSLKPHIITHNSTLRVLIPDEHDGDTESTKRATADIELVYVTRLSTEATIRGSEAYGSSIKLGITDRIMYMNAREVLDMSFGRSSESDGYGNYGNSLRGLLEDRASPASDCVVNLSWTQQGVDGTFVCSNLSRVNLDAGIAGLSANKYSASGKFSCPYVSSF